MLTLIRYNFDPKFTQGLFFVGNEYCCDALELPWKDNQRNISCIPEGLYRIKFGTMHDGLLGYKLETVPCRDGIWIHPADNVGQLRGCVATGTKHGELLYYNTAALKRIHTKLGNTAEFNIVKERVCP